ncbi:MAG: hypothetical protein OEZ51_12155 [Nitrospinota bacterium]|nr:hypothetical protein [Nitrospinota bacterium]
MGSAEIMIRRKITSLALLFVFLMACETTGYNYKELDLSKVDENEGVVIGKVGVEFNSKPFDKRKCVFCIGSVCHQLLGNGYVFMPVEKGTVPRVGISCDFPGLISNGSKYFFGPDQFVVGPGITYMGNLLFSVNIASSSTYATPLREYDKPVADDSKGIVGLGLDGLVGTKPHSYSPEGIEDFGVALAGNLFVADDTPEARTYNELSYEVSIDDDMSDVREAFLTQINRQEIQIEKKIIKVGIK